MKKTNDLLLVTDMQNIYTSGQEWACVDTEGAARRILEVIDSGRCADVIFTRFIAEASPQGVWKDYNEKYRHINESAWANGMLPCFADALKKYPLYTKSVYSSLAVPEILSAAKRAGRVAICGVVAECCVLSTVFSLIDAGIYVVYLTDAVSGLTKEKEAAAELTLSGLSPLHIALMTVEEYLNEN